MSRSRLESYKRLVSVSSRLVKPTSRSRGGGGERLSLEFLRLVPIPGCWYVLWVRNMLPSSLHLALVHIWLIQVMH